ncbi:hypothetical protein TYRP_005723 [Tyrophagus putrescentiae]|nr:hypothetical protein TYRP_005723 [Tyrophagus putrescentiae]
MVTGGPPVEMMVMVMALMVILSLHLISAGIYRFHDVQRSVNAREDASTSSSGGDALETIQMRLAISES